VKRAGYVLIIGVAVVLGGIAGFEHIARRILQRRFHQAVGAQQQAERKLQELVVVHDQLKAEWLQEQQRSTELSETLKEKQEELVVATSTLAEQAQTVRQLQSRLETMDRQMSQLQGELALALQQADTSRGDASGAVQLERVLIGTASGQPGMSGRVVSVHEDWSFVVINLGWNAVRIGDLVSIFRNDQLLAKARVERVQEGVAAATILPEWEDNQVQVNDVVRVL
jgi:hypothetical protein